MATNPPLSREAASRLGTIANVGRVQVFSLMAKLDEQPQEQASLTWNLKAPEFLWDLEGRDLVALLVLEISISMRATELEAERRLGIIHVGYRLEYSFSDEISNEEDIPHFVGITGFLQVWPYLRAEVQMLTAKLGLPALTLPVLLVGQAATMATVKHVSEVASSAMVEKAGTDEA
jgi:hypothetical protein